MLELLRHLLMPSQYIPHGHCYLWQTPLVWLHVVSDALVAIAYFSIPAMLIYFVRKREDIPFSKVFLLFGAFIVLCGTGHLLDIWTLWYPAYWVSGVERAVTALVSCYTALQLVELLPQFLALKTPEQLEIINRELERQVAERQHTEQTLQMIVAGTASVTGQDFFPALVRHLANALDVATVVVSEKADDSFTALRSLAAWSGDRLIENFEYELANTPCNYVVTHKHIQQYPKELQQLFPNNALLETLDAESYVGVPLCDVNQKVIGSLCLIDTKPFLADERTKVLMRVFAERAVTELQRKWAEDEKRRAYEELEFRVEERTEQLRQAKEAADAASRAKGEFLAHMSHELRTPLNAILGLAQLLSRDKTLNPDHHYYLKTIGESGEHLLALINEVLEMSKIEAGTLTSHESSFNLQQLIDSLKDMLHVRAASKGLQFNVECCPNLPTVVKTDEGKLRQILINLLGNAIKFTSHGVVTLRVSLMDGGWSGDDTVHTGDGKPPFRSRASSSRLLFEVEDTGPGVAPDELEQLFKPFEQCRTGVTVADGTGLGLAISQKYAQLLGGGITVCSQLGQGSTFSFCIPVTLAKTTTLTHKKAIAGRVIGLAPHQPTYRILVVEDNPTNRLLLTKLLDNFGFELKEATNGKEAIALWQTWKPDLIIMDMRLPIMRGQEATQHIRVLERHQYDERSSPTKILALTASAFVEEQEEILAAGCDDLVCKPYKIEEILEKIACQIDVEYLYESPSEPSVQLEMHQPLDTALLRGMPSVWIEQLSQAALQCNDIKILRLTKDIEPTHAVLAKQLNSLATQFQFDKITSSISQL